MLGEAEVPAICFALPTGVPRGQSAVGCRPPGPETGTRQFVFEIAASEKVEAAQARLQNRLPLNHVTRFVLVMDIDYIRVIRSLTGNNFFPFAF